MSMKKTIDVLEGDCNYQDGCVYDCVLKKGRKNPKLVILLDETNQFIVECKKFKQKRK